MPVVPSFGVLAPVVQKWYEGPFCCLPVVLEVVRRPVVRCAGSGKRDRVLAVIPAHARRAERDRVPEVIKPHAGRARWLGAGVVRSCGWQKGTRDQRPNTPMQPTASRARSSAF
jgi:hypothetical protein